MCNKLSKLDSSSIEELQDISKNVKEYVNTENNAMHQAALAKINQQPTFLQKLFPTRFQKMQQEFMIQNIQNIHNAKEQMFALYTGIQLEIARQQGDALIASTGMHLQDHLTNFAASKIDSLTDTLEKSMNSFMEKIYRQRGSVENYNKFPDLADRYEQSLKKEQEIYFSSIEQLLENFKDTLNRKVKEFDKK